MQEATPPLNADARGKPTLAPDLARHIGQVARAIVAAGRSWALYPPEHPAVSQSLERLAAAIEAASGGQTFGFAVTPDTLLVDGIPAATKDGPVSEAATWLHQRDILELSFAPNVPPDALQALLVLLTADLQQLRDAGGPAKAWADQGHPAIAIEQIDFARVLEDRDVQHPARKKDELWKAIVRAVIDRRKTLDEAVQRRLLDIAGDAIAIGELANDVIAPNFSADGSPMLTTQAAAVVAAYRHLVGIVDVMAPERRAEVMQNLATATANLNPRVVMELMHGANDPASGDTAVDIRSGLAAAFDDIKVAQLLATTLAIDGQASDRLAEVFDTIAPDEPRKRRVLTMTRSLLSETSFGRTDQFHTLWTSMEELLLTYNEKPFVSQSYQTGLDEAGRRAERMAADVPADLADLIATLNQDNVRRLSVTLLIDLLRLEHDATRAPEVARDVAALGEDLLLAGDYDGAVAVTQALAEHAANPASIASQGCRVALDGLVQTTAFVETIELLGEMSDDEAAKLATICAQIGPAAADALKELLVTEHETTAMRRARPMLKSYGARVITRVAPLFSDQHWFAQRNVAQLAGEVGAPEAVPLLQPLLRGSDPRVLRAAVQALANIDDPAAARAVHTVLRAAAGDQRRAVVEALVAEKDPRVVPLLVRILNESHPLGADHQIVLETLGAIRDIGGDQAVPHVATVMRCRSWFARKKVRAVKMSSLEALRGIGTPAAARALEDAATNGDRLLRKLAKISTTAPVAHG